MGFSIVFLVILVRRNMILVMRLELIRVRVVFLSGLRYEKGGRVVDVRRVSRES